MKLKKSQLKEWIKEDIQEFLSEQEDNKKPEGPKQAKTDIMDNPFVDEEKEDIEEGGPGSGRPKGDVGGPAHPNVPKKKSKKSKKSKERTYDPDFDEKKHMTKDGRIKFKTWDSYNPQGKPIKESGGKRTTVKEIKKWMKTLEENRYKKTYASDARRVSWMVNHMGESVENMPKSMSKKWSKAQYGRERYLAKEFLKSKLNKLKEQLKEQKLRESIRKIIKRLK